MSREIFALDIGTRKVMGIVAEAAGGSLRIADVETQEHAARPMLDGQVHSIRAVADTVAEIKAALEKRLSRPLTAAGVAVAGRNLLTHTMRIEHAVDPFQEITQDMVRSLELDAIGRIISDAGAGLSDFYCVGYSPVHYELDGERLQDLVGHRAGTIGAEVIATFLPRVVLDSIFSVLAHAGLEPVNITLEPIAAMNAIVPAEMRRLNIILVDIGAGTSDMALSRDGLVFAYGMVPEAGDEITECICGHYVVDFSTGEHIKRSIGTCDEISYKDIWDRSHTVKAQSVREVIRPAVQRLASSIAATALELNGGVPQAVIAVGGGALTPGLLHELAGMCGLPAQKVGIRLPSAIKGLLDQTGRLSGPEAVTPIGIASMTSAGQGMQFINVTVNGARIKMLDLSQKKDVLGALSLSGVMRNKRLYPRMGMAVSVEVNGVFKTIKGTMGQPAKITINGAPAGSLTVPVRDGDCIELVDAVDGEDASAKVSDVIGHHRVRCILNNELVSVPMPVTMNGAVVPHDAPVVDRARIATEPVAVHHVLRHKGIEAGHCLERQILVNINNTPRVLPQRNYTLTINGRAADLDTPVSQGDAVFFQPQEPSFYRVRDVVDIPEGIDRITINVNGRDIDIGLRKAQVFMNGHEVSPDEFLVDGADITVYYSKQHQVLLSEIFNYIDVDASQALGKRMRFFVDDAPAGFTTRVPAGAQVRIVFEDRN
ncbi:MAG TPA: rod shape-determining protein [Candidatus Omnitrophota bacterium]|nr:rod shape-determining protein [Candidatus Omnitrophota bacterium]HQQ05424.1 rod shape-determining protein [Candidatus Omnitrophota bacterium]